MRKPARIGILLMVLTVALAAIGVASALWYDELYVDGVVTTGYVDVEPSLLYIEENDHGKDVATCDAFLYDWGWMIEIRNGYPSYECLIGIDIHNVGTIPVHIYHPMWMDWPPQSAMEFQVLDCWEDDFQLHSGEMATCVFYFHILQEAEQNATYTFYGWVEARQFNEPRDMMP
jgi:hypothetical protein